MNNNIKAGADLHAGDGGYSVGTKEKYDEFVKGRNQSLGKMRIRELYEQAHEEQSPISGQGRLTKDILWEQPKKFNPEKFAELIVAEMLQTCEDHPAWTGRMIGEKIKQHFGVEE